MQRRTKEDQKRRKSFKRWARQDTAMTVLQQLSLAPATAYRWDPDDLLPNTMVDRCHLDGPSRGTRLRGFSQPGFNYYNLPSFGASWGPGRNE